MPKPYGEALENELPVGEKEKNRDSDTGRETTEALPKQMNEEAILEVEPPAPAH